jgi:hypothetical protein
MLMLQFGNMKAIAFIPHNVFYDVINFKRDYSMYIHALWKVAIPTRVQMSIGATGFGPWKQIWKSWAPGKCKFFLWTAALNRIWTADHLASKGLSHLAACPLCDQVEETADHLLVACVFSCQVWFAVLQMFNLQTLAPQNDLSFFEWWMAASSRVDGLVRKGLDSILVLGAWTIWKHRNRCVFDGLSPNVSCVVSVIKEELHHWSFAGARGVPHLLALGPLVV